MSDVFKAEDLALGRTIALKFLKKESARERQAVERFRREARAISGLNHQNICTIYEIGEADGQYFIAMEFLPGETLRNHVSGKALEVGEVLDIGMQIADALDSAHSQGVIESIGVDASLEDSFGDEESFSTGDTASPQVTEAFLKINTAAASRIGNTSAAHRVSLCTALGDLKGALVSTPSGAFNLANCDEINERDSEAVRRAVLKPRQRPRCNDWP